MSSPSLSEKVGFAEMEFNLLDGSGRVLGGVTVDEIRGQVVLGTFREAPAFQEVKPLFQEFVEAVNQQLFSHLDDLDARITALALRLQSAGHVQLPEIGDVQIEGENISFRL